ncbi:uncharacterized protein BP5553_09321 [Venustampulla echinocandica]|uniref:Uncharacterized protein n=1 Tax=Venustampulla echinocandica TaxID=2656787 RepID=A0A370TCD6_9HELO|nr:uncharacterized protein BP5553_09321 [Venustampulla echinocandica]RDL31919.1 hypothetical protein BP5553_09321 [Venustampulla echinocandica]
MKLLAAFSIYSLLGLCIALPPTTDGASLMERDPTLRAASRDCGTFKFKCNKAAGACNNACYFINCVNKGNKKFTFGNSPVDNRVHSGCTTSISSTICKLAPLGQRMWDRQSNDIAPKPLQCDEFPMNAFKQAEFKEGTVRNSLRCINGGENGSGGSQFKQFVRAQGDWKKGGALAGDRKCDGEMKDGDTFEVDWIIDGKDGVDDQDKFVPYCKPKPNCANDGFQFHMSKLQIPKDKKTGQMSQPYNYITDNHYAVTSKSDMMQYRVKISRKGDENFETEVFQVNGKDEVSKGKKTGTMKSNTDSLEIKGLPRSLYVFRTGNIGTKLDFSYTKSGTTFWNIDFPGGDVGWSTDDKGVAGAWCTMGDVKTAKNVPAEQQIQCDFPGLKDA